jgi:hypothetical protein
VERRSQERNTTIVRIRHDRHRIFIVFPVGPRHGTCLIDRPRHSQLPEHHPALPEEHDTVTKPKQTPKPPQKTAPRNPVASDSILSPIDHYQHEKDKRARKEEPEDELMAAARREYKALLEAQAAKGKGGRPKKKAATRTEDSESDTEELSGDE